ncbi:MAG: hypothetical protein RIQ71_2365 [Verrucomicrobiota bacterium]
MIGHQLYEAIFKASKPQPPDRRSFWHRLLASLRIDIKPGKSVDKPVAYVGIKVKAEF